MLQGAKGDFAERRADLAGAVAGWIEDRLVEAEQARAPRVQALLDGAAILEAAGRADLARAARGQAAK